MVELTTDELKAKEHAVRREFPETDKAFAAVKDAMLKALLDTADPETEKRERLFHSIRALEAVRTVMMSYLTSGSEDIDAYIKEITAAEA